MSRTYYSMPALWLVIATSLATFLLSCSAEDTDRSQGSQHTRTRTAAGSECVEGCVNAEMEQYQTQGCIEECQNKRQALHLDPSVCDDLCAEAVEARTGLVGRQCKSRCHNDQDGDGVPDQLDECNETVASTPTTWRGCADGDGDTVPDTSDNCAGTSPGTRVDTQGCSIATTCSNGKCTNYYPACASETECDRQSEVPLTRQVPLEHRQELIERMLKREYADVTCPDDDTAPPQPDILMPQAAIDQQYVGQATVEFVDGSSVGGTAVQLDFQWEAVDDPCPPVEYSLYLESYYCDEVNGVDEPVSYYRNGWCRWEPLLYESTTQTSYQFDFDFGEHLYDIHQRFGSALSWNPPQDGTFIMNYRPYWIRLRVIAHDGNARSSTFGNHEPHKYIVLHAKAALDALNRIPVAP